VYVSDIWNTSTIQMNSDDSHDSHGSFDGNNEHLLFSTNDSDDRSMGSVELVGNELSAVPDSITLQLTPGIGFGAHRRHNSSSSQTIQLCNSCDHAIAFKIKSKHATRYRVKPALGIVDSLGQCDIDIAIADLGVNPADTVDDVFLVEWCVVADADQLRQSDDALRDLWAGIQPDDKLFLYVMCLVESTASSPPGGGPQQQSPLPPAALVSPANLPSPSSFVTFLPPPPPSGSLPAPPSPRNDTPAEPLSEAASSPAQLAVPLRTFRRSPSGKSAQGQATAQATQGQGLGFRRGGTMTVRSLNPPAAAPKKVKLWRKGDMYKETAAAPQQYLQFTLATTTTQFPVVNGERSVRSYAVDFLRQVRPSAALSDFTIVDGNTKTIDPNILVKQLPLVARCRQLKLQEVDNELNLDF
jgi:hypothetical protein